MLVLTLGSSSLPKARRRSFPLLACDHAPLHTSTQCASIWRTDGLPPVAMRFYRSVWKWAYTPNQLYSLGKNTFIENITFWNPRSPRFPNQTKTIGFWCVSMFSNIFWREILRFNIFQGNNLCFSSGSQVLPKCLQTVRGSTEDPRCFARCTSAVTPGPPAGLAPQRRYDRHHRWSDGAGLRGPRWPRCRRGIGCGSALVDRSKWELNSMN